jgi:hypothetical protein
MGGPVVGGCLPLSYLALCTHQLRLKYFKKRKGKFPMYLKLRKFWWLILLLGLVISISLYARSNPHTVVVMVTDPLIVEAGGWERVEGSLNASMTNGTTTPGKQVYAFTAHPEPDGTVALYVTVPGRPFRLHNGEYAIVDDTYTVINSRGIPYFRQGPWLSENVHWWYTKAGTNSSVMPRLNQLSQEEFQKNGVLVYGLIAAGGACFDNIGNGATDTSWLASMVGVSPEMKDIHDAMVIVAYQDTRNICISHYPADRTPVSVSDALDAYQKAIVHGSVDDGLLAFMTELIK